MPCAVVEPTLLVLTLPVASVDNGETVTFLLLSAALPHSLAFPHAPSLGSVRQAALPHGNYTKQFTAFV